MKIGIVDSGIGGLVIMKGIIKKIPQYDYIYLGDTKNSPYGVKSHEKLYELVVPIIDYLFEKKDCKLIVLACNSLSSQVLRKLQQEYLPKKFPDRRILGVLIPVAEHVSDKYKTVGVLGTMATIKSNAYLREIHKLNKSIKVIQKSATDLVDFIELGLMDSLIFDDSLRYYKPFIGKTDALIPGCTHFPLVSGQIAKIFETTVIDTPKVIATSLKDYLKRHSEIENMLSKEKKREYYLTDNTVDYENLTKTVFGDKIEFLNIEL